jgi:caa(3)-type oxidase subunit IV
MKAGITIIYILLLLLTGLTSLIAQSNNSKVAVAIILLIALSKIILVAFYFMELKDAHKAWRTIVLMTGLLIVGSMVILY